jgi:hypothetical protein
VCRFRVATGRRRVNKYRKRRPCWSAIKPVRITFSRNCLLFSWSTYLGFLTKGNLAAIFIIPSSWGSQLAGYLLHQLGSISSLPPLPHLVAGSHGRRCVNPSKNSYMIMSCNQLRPLQLFFSSVLHCWVYVCMCRFVGLSIAGFVITEVNGSHVCPVDNILSANPWLFQRVWNFQNNWGCAWIIIEFYSLGLIQACNGVIEVWSPYSLIMVKCFLRLALRMTFHFNVKLHALANTTKSPIWWKGGPL